MSRICSTCNILLKNERCLIAHVKSKRHIDRTRSPTMNGSAVCKGCKKTYATRQSLNVHRRTCTAVPLIPDRITAETIEELKNTVLEDRRKYQTEREEYLKEREEDRREREELRSQITLLMEKANSNTTTNNTNSHNNIETQHITTNININAFVNENTDYLDDRAILACIDRVYKSIPSLLEKLHFDPNHPENHNIKINNKKLPYASVMGNNQKWKTVDRKDAIETMVQKGYNLLDEKYTDNKDKFSPIKQQNFEGFQKKFEADDKDLARQLKSEVELMVLNGA